MADQLTLEVVLDRLQTLEQQQSDILTLLQRMESERVGKEVLDQEWFTVQEFARITGLQPRTVQKRCHDGRYQTDSHVPGHRLRIHYRHVLEHLESEGKDVRVAFRKLNRKTAVKT